MGWQVETPDADLTITVVVPTHDRREQVHAALRSIAHQDFAGHLEILVVFDNAQPHPIELDLPPRRHLRVLVNDQRTPGLAGARNTGFLAASGPLVACCDDDDEWLPGKLAAQVAALRAFGDDALCTTGSLIVGPTRVTRRPGPDGVVPFERFLHSREMELHSSSFLVERRVLLERIGLVDEGLPRSYAEDYDLLLRASREATVLNVPQPLVSVAFHAGSFYHGQWQTMVEGLTHLMDKFPELERPPKARARLHGQLAFAHVAMGDRVRARSHLKTTLAGNRWEKRAYVVMLALAGMPASWIAGLARRRGHGI